MADFLSQKISVKIRRGLVMMMVARGWQCGIRRMMIVI
jgi:hypothetical protein